jgi:predicted permease
LIVESFRDRSLTWFQDVARDVTYGFRTLRRSPGFTLTALLSLALGIGATTGIFSLFDQVLLRPLRGVHEPERLVLLNWNGRDLATNYGGGPQLSYPVCRELQEQTHVFEGVFCRHPAQVYLSSGKQQDIVRGEIVSGSYFTVLGVRPERGRLIEPTDDLQPDAHPVVVLSYAYWQTALAGAPDAVGRQVLLNGHPMTVIGIAPATFRGVDVGETTAVWIPAMMKRRATPEWDRLFDRRAVWLHVFGRLKPNLSAAQASAALQPWFTSMLESDARHERVAGALELQRRQFMSSTIEALPAPQGYSPLRDNMTRSLWLLMGGTALLLLLTASNVAGLLLARGAARTRELTTRLAIGATRGRVVRQLAVENALLAAAGGGLGLVIAPAVSRLLLSFVDRNADLTARLDPRVFVFAVFVCALIGAICAVAPLLQIRSLPLNERAPVRAVGSARFRKVLVVGQMAFTLILLIGAGLFVQTVSRLEAKAPAAAPRVLTFGADPLGIGRGDARARDMMRTLFRKLQTLPEVESVGVANTTLLMGGSFSRGLTIQTEPQRITDRNVYGLRVSPGFFATLGTRILAGREFDERDTLQPEASAEYRSVIVNRSFARRYFGDRNPVGHRLGIGIAPGTPTTIEIVGMIEDISYVSLRLTENEHIFFPFWDQGAENGVFFVRIRGQAEPAAESIRAAVAEVEPALPHGTMSFEEHMSRSLTNERMLAALSSGFGSVALLISIVGLYGVMAFVAAQRTREIGVRLALGATRTSAVWLIVRDAVKMVVAGVAVAVPVGWLLGRIVESQLFGVGAFDQPTIAAAGSSLAVVAIAAAALPAWRAAMLPPMVAIGDQPESMWQAARVKVRHAIRDLTAPRERPVVAPAALIRELTDLVRGAESFPEALHVALGALRERAGARSIVLLERVPTGEYRGGELSVPAGGILLKRLMHYVPPLPLAPGDFDAWRRWAGARRPNHLDEIEILRGSGARLAVALRNRQEIVGVLLLGPPDDRTTFTDSEKELLGSAAEIFALLIENGRLNARAIEQEKVRRDLALAAEVQRRLLPPRPPACATVTLAAFTLPARTVGGDYYDFLELGGDRTAIAVADVAGKGIAAALLMSVVQASLRVIAADGDIASADLATRLNRFLYQSTAANHYATFFYAELDGGRRRLRYVNAGHNPPHLVRRTETGVEIVDLSAGGTVLGLFPDAAYEDAEIELRGGDLFVAFTDGVPEALNAGGEEFGEERLKDLLRRGVGASAEEVSATLAGQLRAWIAGTEQHDDLTFVVAVVK